MDEGVLSADERSSMASESRQSSILCSNNVVSCYSNVDSNHSSEYNLPIHQHQQQMQI